MTKPVIKTQGGVTATIYPLFMGGVWMTVCDGGEVLYDGIPADGSQHELKAILAVPKERLPLLIGAMKTGLGAMVLERLLK